MFGRLASAVDTREHNKAVETTVVVELNNVLLFILLGLSE